MAVSESTSLAMIRRLRPQLPRRFEQQNVMASPPTASMGAANVNSLNYSTTTNAATASGNVLHFASNAALAALIPGMAVLDFSTFGVIPIGTVVVSSTSTSVTLSNNVANAGVGSGDTIVFQGRQWPAVNTQSNGYSGVGGDAWSTSGAALPQVTSSTFFPNAVQWTSVNYSVSSRKFNHAVVMFDYYQAAGSSLNIGFYGQANAAFFVKIDDQYLSLTPISLVSDGNNYWYTIKFAAAGWHRVEILMPANSLFQGLWTGPQDIVTPSVMRGPRVVVVGDSYAEGSGSSNFGTTSWAQRLFEFMGWSNYLVAAVGGTGLLETFGSSPNYLGRIATDVIPFKPDIVIFQGSVNDPTGSFTPNQMAAQVKAIYQAVIASLPATIVVFTSPPCRSGATSTSNLVWAQKDAMKSTALSLGALWIDLMERPLPNAYTPATVTLAANANVSATSLVVSGATPVLGAVYKFSDGTRIKCTSVSGVSSPYTITTEAGGLQTAQVAGVTMVQTGSCPWTGSGRSGSPQYDGSCDILIDPDGIHQTQAGHDMIAQIAADDLVFGLTGDAI